MFDALIKAGGSQYDMDGLRACAAQWAALAARYRLMLLPGGGPFADQVRAADARLGLSDSAAHWMAVLAMDQYAYLLADLAPGAALVRDLESAVAACAAGRLAVLAPSALLLRADPLPHTWQVTSDSLAAWVAGQASARMLVLLKDVAGVLPAEPPAGQAAPLPQVERQALPAYAVVDSYFSQVLPAGLDCWIIDGRRPERLAALLETGRAPGTQVVEGMLE